MGDFGAFKEALQALVNKFERDKNHYLQKGYPEAQVRIDFLNPFFAALGWDIENKTHKQFTSRTPIRTIDFNNPSEKALHDKLVSLVDRMLDLHKKKAALPPSAERDKIEREIAVMDEKIDEIVYGLYGIIDEERKIVE